MRSARSIAKTAALPLILGITSAALCALASAWNPLGTFLGSIALATLIVPPLTAHGNDRWTAFIVAGSVMDGMGLAWLACVFASPLTFMQWLACYVVLIAYVMALWGLARTIGMTGAIVLASAWLTWPVWLTPHITGSISAWLTPAHPLLAINHVLLNHGVWLQQPLMYQISALGQDVPYTLPRSIWPCVILHLLVATGILWSRGSLPALSSSPATAAEG